MNSIALSIANLQKSYNHNRVLDGVSLSISRGEVLAIIGPSGSGKTTLLRCISLLDEPEKGTVLLGDTRVFDSGPPRVVNRRVLRTGAGMVFQHLYLWPHLSVLQNIIEAPLRVRHKSKREATEQAETLLESVGMLDKAKEYPGSLSGGQKQRVAICRALIMKPDVLLLDEITSALDPELVDEILDVIRDLAKQGQTMMVITHEMMFARDVADRIAFLDEGRVLEIGKPAQILTEPKEERTRRFLTRVLYSKQMGR